MRHRLERRPAPRRTDAARAKRRPGGRGAASAARALPRADAAPAAPCTGWKELLRNLLAPRRAAAAPAKPLRAAAPAKPLRAAAPAKPLRAAAPAKPLRAAAPAKPLRAAAPAKPLRAAAPAKPLRAAAPAKPLRAAAPAKPLRAAAPAKPLRAAVALAALLAAAGAALQAHDIPSDVTVRAFVKPEGDRLRMLVRVPLEALLDVNFPLRGPGYLDVEGAERLLPDAAMLWLGQEIELYEDGVRLPEPTLAAVRLSLPSNRAFDSYEEALAHVTAGERLPPDTQIIWRQALLDVLLDYDTAAAESAFSIRPGVERLGLRVVSVIRFLTPAGAERAFELRGDPGVVTLDPRWHQAAWNFVVSGFDHILDGIDHLLFLLCLVVPFRRFRALVPIVTGFTVAHSVTLIAAAYDLAPDTLWFPPLVETLIAVSIVYMALENVVAAGAAGAAGAVRIRRRWVVAFGFGLVHGFGFSFALRETLQFAGSHLLTSLLAFNVGVELGQLLVIALCVPALELLFRFGVSERIGTILISALVAHTSLHWMAERYETFSQYPVTWAALAGALLAGIIPWLILALAAAACAWYGLRRRLRPAAEAPAE